MKRERTPRGLLIRHWVATLLIPLVLLFIYHLIYIKPIWEGIAQTVPLEKLPSSVFGSLITVVGSLYALFGVAIAILTYFGLREISDLKETRSQLEKKFILLEAELLYDRKKYDEAWENLLKLPDDNWEVCLYKGLVKYQFGDTNDALRYYSHALTLKECDLAVVYYSRGLVYSKLKEYALAVKDYDKAIEIKNNYALPYVGKSYAIRRLLGVEEALKIVELGIKVDPSCAKLFYNKACYLSLLNNGKDAMESLKKALELNPELRINALTDPDFKNIINMEEYRNVVACLPFREKLEIKKVGS